MKKLFNYILILFMVVGNTYLLINDLNHNDNSRVPTYLSLYALLLIPTIMKKVIKFKISTEIEIVYFIFILLAQFLGSGVNLYAYISWFDTFTHFLSGVLTCFVALILLHLFGNNPKRKIAFHITYILGIVFLIACLWEFFEFGMDQLAGMNLQHSIESGVTDTMCDILAAFSGSILFLCAYTYEMLSNTKGFITKFIDSL